MKRRTRKPQQAWHQAPPKPEKKVRHFNQPSGSFQGKILLNDHTWVDYDYGVYPPNLVLKNKFSNNNQEEPIESNPNTFKNQFSVGKYPTLRKIVKEIPKSAHAKEMDLYLIRDMEESLIWKNDGFEFSN